MPRERITMERLMKPAPTGFQFGVISLFFVGIAFLFTLFVNVGGRTSSTENYVDMLTIGFFGSFIFSSGLIYMRLRRKKRGEQVLGPTTPISVVNQFTVVLPVGILIGTITLLVNTVTYSGGNLLLGSLAGAVDPTNLFLVVMAGVAEELFFRGFLQTMFELFFGATTLGRYLAPIPSAAIFAWFHFYAYAGNPAAFITMFAIGLMFGYAHAISNDIGVPILAHVVNNVVAALPAVILMLQANILLFGLLFAVGVIVFVIAATTGMKRRSR